MKKILVTLITILLITVGVCWAGEKSLTFKWEQEISDDFKGWTFFHTTNSTLPLEEWEQSFDVDYSNGTESGNVITYSSNSIILSADNEEVIHYFYAVAKDTNGNVSDPSNVANATIDFKAPKQTFILSVEVDKKK